MVAFSNEKAHDFTWHGRNDLLAAFGLDAAVAAAAPGTRIDDFSSEFLRAGLQLQLAVRRWRHVDFEGLTVKKNGKRVGSDLDRIDGYCLAIQRHAPAGAILFEPNDASFLSGGG